MKIILILVGAFFISAFLFGNDGHIVKDDRLSRAYKILKTGVYDKASIGNIDNLKWFGLFKLDSDFVLEPVELKAELCPLPYSSQPDDTNGLSITVTNHTAPLFLIGCSGNLDSGAVTTYFAGDTFINAGVLVFLGMDCLTALGQVTDEGMRHPSDILTLDYQAILIIYPYSRNNRQILVSHDRTAGEDTPSLLWAGDLDRDGKIDLLLDVSNHYAGRHYVLYLSSEADAGELVKPVAELIVSGC